MGAGSDRKDPAVELVRERWQRLWDEIPEVETEVFGRVLAPSSLEQLMIVIKQVSMIGIGAWRGQADATWRIDPSLVRRYRDQRGFLGPKYSVDEPRLRRLEKATIEEAREAGFLDPEPELELLARIQHHGGATRLLDATRNAFVALWFASQGSLNSDGVLLGFRLSEQRALHVNSSMLKRDVDWLLNEAKGKILWWRPRNLSPRIAAQQAVVVFSEIVEHPWGTINFTGDAEFRDAGSIPDLITLLVSEDLKRELNAQWEEVFGYTEASLFPDFDGFALSHSIARDFPVTFPI